MARLSQHTDFAKEFISFLPAPADITEQSVDYWTALEVNVERILGEITDKNYLQKQLNSFGLAALRSLSIWFGLNPEQKKEDLTETLADHFSNNHTNPACQSIFLLSEFLYRKRADAIETISKLLLPNKQWDLILESTIDVRSARLCYALLVFVKDPRKLRLLLLFENAEKTGYVRCILMALTEKSGRVIDDESINRAEEKIRKGLNLEVLNREIVDSVLQNFETRHGGLSSRCFDVFRDEVNGITMVFVLRYLRESIVREVEEVLFANEAELIVLRFLGNGRYIEEHSTKYAGGGIAAAIASTLVEEPDLIYIEDTQDTAKEKFEELVKVLIGAEDERLHLQEIYLDYAPLPEAPKLILRCDKTQTLAEPFAFLKEKNIDLFQDLGKVRNINIAYVIESAKRDQEAYIFKIFCQRLSSGNYYLPYSVGPIATSIRATVENYLRDNYDVQIIPGITSP